MDMNSHIKVRKGNVQTILSALVFLIAVFSPFNDGLTTFLVLFISGIVLIVGKTYTEIKLLTEKDALYLLGLFTLIGFSIRIYNLENLSLWYDESISAIAIDSMNNNIVPSFDSGKSYLRGITYSLIGFLSTNIFGFTDFALRLPSVITGTLSIPLTYLTGLKMYNRSIGLIASVIISFSWWSIVWSRQARMYSLLQLTFLSSILMIYIFVEEPEWKKGSATILLMIFTMLTHVTAYILPLILLSYSVYVYRNRLKNRNNLMVVAFAILTLVMIYMLYFNYWSILTRFNYSPGNAVEYIQWMIEEIRLVFLLGLSGLIMSLRDFEKSSVLLAVSSVPVFFVYSFLIEETASRYLYVILPFLCISSAFFIHHLANSLEQLNIENKKSLLAISLVFLLVGNFASGGYSPGLHAPQADFKSAYELVSEESTSQDIVISGWTPPAVRYYGKPDYALAGNFYTVEKRSWNGSEEYSGSVLIHGSKELSKVIESSNEAVWIVLDERAWRGQSSEVKSILSRLNLVGEFKEIKVWRTEE